MMKRGAIVLEDEIDIEVAAEYLRAVAGEN